MRATAAVETDWAVLDLEGVREVTAQAARRVHKRYADYTEVEDLKQDALIFVATRPNLQAPAYDEELGLLQFRLEQDLVESIETEVKHRKNTISYSAVEVQDEHEEGTYVRPYVQIETTSNEYTRESVESLLPAVWDEDYAYGLPKKDTAPDPDMPRGAVNVAHGNDLSAYIADIQVGWEKTPLTRKERIALLLAFGFGWTQREIAYNQNVSQQTISERIYTAVGKIVARLNGGLWFYLMDVEA